MSEKTVHKDSTPHGFSTVHKFPSESTSDLNTLNDLSVQLYPTGRAWNMPEGGVFECIHDALNQSFARLVSEGRLLLDGIFTDNDNFSENDASLWEHHLGLITNPLLDLEVRKESIRRKQGYPNNIKPRQHRLFIEHQLQLAGFDVFVHENTVPYQNPGDIVDASPEKVNHGGGTQHDSNTQHGGANFSLIANSVDDFESYSVGGDENLWATFFIGGAVLGDMADVPSDRMVEFKELVIKLKPAHTVAFTFINYI